MSTIRQAQVILTSRYLRELYRQPAVIVITLLQPVIWLLLFGALFQRVVQIPGFGGGSYITYLTPGVVIMTAIFSASWAGMAYIEDMQTGVMERFLVSPASRGALVTALLAYQAVITVVQTAMILALGWATGARFGGAGSGAGGSASGLGVLAGLAALTVAAVLLALAAAGLSVAFALLTRQREALIGVSTTLVLPLTFLSGAFLSLRLVPSWIASVARFNPVNWAASSARIAVTASPAWGTVASYALFLAAAVLVTATAAAAAFRAFQRAA